MSSPSIMDARHVRTRFSTGTGVLLSVYFFAPLLAICNGNSLNAGRGGTQMTAFVPPSMNLFAISAVSRKTLPLVRTLQPTAHRQGQQQSLLRSPVRPRSSLLPVFSSHGHSHSHSHEDHGHGHSHEHDHEPAKAAQEFVLTMDEVGDEAMGAAAKWTESAHQSEHNEHGHDCSGHSHDHEECGHSHESAGDGHTHEKEEEAHSHSHSHAHTHSHDGVPCTGHDHHEHEVAIPAAAGRQPAVAAAVNMKSTDNNSNKKTTPNDDEVSEKQQLSSVGMAVEMGKWLVKDGGKLSTIACFVLIVFTKIVKVCVLQLAECMRACMMCVCVCEYVRICIYIHIIYINGTILYIRFTMLL
jgi:hypothetical protein